MLAVTYYGALSDEPVTEYLCVLHDGYAGDRARRLLAEIFHKEGSSRHPYEFKKDNFELDEETINDLNLLLIPSSIEYTKDGKFFRVLDRNWNDR
jgi:DNA repair protein RadD